ncbi:GTPase domain-containing protein [Granulosicoccaceae sp. 1_MG-2023]|nr:GTPase domain-containing protein [Granulosicoccaceae sp. 1_MG-2023]
MLDNLLPELQAGVADWANDLHDKHWIDETTLNELTRVDTRSAAGLFGQEERPLVVGFFGGTGVGKSSLLNRLAGQAIARTGVERPTSREVTVYLHHDLPIAHLPDAFPTDKVKLALHKSEANRHVLWVDMPDFDSAEQANRDMVLAWLPYIDVLMYVVNPERYKDDQGWRMLLEFGHQHAWLFVINHWDRGVEEQRDDFRNLLSGAGLANPVIFRTDCNPDREQAVDDDFALLQRTIQELADDNIIRHLEERGVRQKIEELQARTRSVVATLGNEQDIDAIAGEWDKLWQTASAKIETSQSWKINEIAAQFTSKETRWFRSAIKALRGQEQESGDTPGPDMQAGAEALWTPAVCQLVDGSIDELLQRARYRDMASGPLKHLLAPLKAQHRELFEQCYHSEMQKALAQPGKHWQRLLNRVLGWLTTLLPILALLWIGYKVVVGFYLGNESGGDYLGFNFAIHSLLLLGVSWLVPWFIYQKSKPSLQEAAVQGMRNASHVTLRRFSVMAHEALEILRQRRAEALAGSESLFAVQLQPGQLADKDKARILARLLTQKVA